MDEALLDACDAGEGGEVLRFWEPRVPFIVLGHSNLRAREVRLERCEADGVPVLRRCSGGGTVVQIPGVLNYSLVLRIPGSGPLATIPGANREIMGRICRALAALPGLSGQLSVRGTTDLCLGERKVMGNAQRRKREALLFHGSILLSADLSLIDRWLEFPSRVPDYRGGRGHGEFCTNLGVPAALVRDGFCAEWGAGKGRVQLPEARLRSLMESRYSLGAWHAKF